MTGKDILLAVMASFFGGLMVWYLQEKSQEEPQSAPVAAFRVIGEIEEEEE